MPGLLFVLGAFARFHNSAMNEARRYRSWLSLDGLIYAARKPTTAFFQKIMVDAVKSVIFGNASKINQPRVMPKLFFYFPLDFKEPSSLCYNPNINPQVSIEFTIALRFYHYFIRDNWGFYPGNVFGGQNPLRGQNIQDIPLFDIFENLDLYNNNKCGLMHGLLDSSWNMFSVGPINHCGFFAKHADQIGSDLRSFDIQYGRVNGEPSFCDSLKFFNGIQDCAGNLTNFISGDMINLLMTKVGDVTNIGLTMGLDLEFKPAAIGPATANIIADQFQRTICGDRFWYNHENGVLTKSK